MSRFDKRLSELLTSKSLVVCVGPGGAGKTTIGASLALRAAQLGRRSVVLTIDPAKRLMTVLGLEEHSHQLSEVWRGQNGSCHAMMLDTRHGFDALIRTIASKDHAAQIFDNAIYQAFSDLFSQSHGYIAMESTYALLTDSRFDLVVLDTPPAANATDILDAPTRLLGFLDQQVLSLFSLFQDSTPPERHGLAKRLVARAQAAGMKAALGAFSRLVGEELSTSLVEFLTLFLPLREGFVNRGNAMLDQLRSKETGFVAVTTVDELSFDDTLRICRELNMNGRAPELALLNRIAAEVFRFDKMTPASVSDGSESQSELPRVLTEETRQAKLAGTKLAGAKLAPFVPGTSAERIAALPHFSQAPQSVQDLLSALDHTATITEL